MVTDLDHLRALADKSQKMRTAQFIPNDSADSAQFNHGETVISPKSARFNMPKTAMRMKFPPNAASTTKQSDRKSAETLHATASENEPDPRTSLDAELALFREWHGILPASDVLSLKGWDLVMCHTLPDGSVRLEKHPTALVPLDLWRRTSRFRSLTMDMSSLDPSPDANLVFRRVANRVRCGPEYPEPRE